MLLRGLIRSRRAVTVAQPLVFRRGLASSWITDTTKAVDVKTRAVAERVSSLVARRQPMYSLPREFYTPEMAAVDLEYVWRTNWLFAGFAYQIPKAGDFFVYKVDRDETILVRGDDGVIRAFANSCRHRGSRLCRDRSGSITKNFVCPYHQWSYNRSGQLTFARDMPNEFDKSKHGLHPVHMREVDGLLYICLSDNTKPPPFAFEPAQQYMSKQLKPHDLTKAKSAHTIIYHVNANWKLVYENNRECYHCNAGHPEYIKSNYDTAFSYSTDPKTGVVHRTVDPRFGRAADITKLMDEKTAMWKEKYDIECTSDNQFPGDGWYRASRMPLRRGFLVESLDGAVVSNPLLGTLTSPDMGSMRIHTLPNFWIHASADHAVSARLTPLSVYTTEVRADWIVHADAVEGKDYDLKKLLPFWQLTSEQDWRLCEENQMGMLTSHYQPGPLSDAKERGLEAYMKWYLKQLAIGANKYAAAPPPK